MLNKRLAIVLVVYCVGVLTVMLFIISSREECKSSDILRMIHSMTNLWMEKGLKSKFPADNNTDITGSKILPQISHFYSYSNIPDVYFKNPNPKNVDKTFLNYPHLFDLKFNNLVWQVLYSPKENFYLYNAYFDDRKEVGVTPVVRIIGAVTNKKPSATKCILFYANSNKTYTSTAKYYFFSAFIKPGQLDSPTPCFITCQAPTIGEPPDEPVAVSLSLDEKNNLQNLLKVRNTRHKVIKDFAVCCKFVFFKDEDISVRMTEWFEILFILGVKKIFIYDSEMHPNIRKLINYYVDRGTAELIPFLYPGFAPNVAGVNLPYRNNKWEVFQFTDCLYRNLYAYKYILVKDVDEIILPLKHSSYQEAIKELEIKNKRASAFKFKHAFHALNIPLTDEDRQEMRQEKIPSSSFFLQHIYQDLHKFTNERDKSVIRVEDILISAHHKPDACLKKCEIQYVDINFGQMKHYRNYCVDGSEPFCKYEHIKRDTSLWRFKESIIERMNRTLTDLQLPFPG